MDEAAKQTFACDVCGIVFVSGWSEDEAVAEKDQLWGDVPLEECGVTCSDCFDKIVAYVLANGVE